jgi:hypothetical protein
MGRMPNARIRRLALLPTAAFLVAQAGCSLVPLEVTADGKIQVEVHGDTNAYSSVVTYDPNENEDYRKYKDQFEKGEIESILIKVLRVKGTNQATWVAGQVDVKAASAGEDGWVTGVSSWQGLRLMGEADLNGNREPLADEIFLNPAEWDNYDELNRVVFQGDKGAIDFRIQGVADTGPVDFDLEITVTFTVEN